MTSFLLQPQGDLPALGTGTTAPGPAAPATPVGAPAGGGVSTLVLFLAFLPLIIMLLLQSRSQDKKRKELEAKLKKGDRVVTQSGIIGKLVELGDRHVKLEIAKGTVVQMLKSSVVELDAEPASKPTTTKDEPAAEKK